MQTENTLSGIEPFRNLSRRDVAAVAKLCRTRRYAAGQQVVGHQEQTGDIFFVVNGKVRVTLYSALGKEVTFRDLGAGEMFGELAAIDGRPRSASVIAMADSLIASMSAQAFWQVLREHPEVAAATLRRLVDHVRDLSERVFEFSTLTVRNRIHAELLRLARTHTQGSNRAVISPAPTHTEIANRVSTHREAVTRELSRLARAGLIERHPGKLVILDVPRLARMVQDLLAT
jgi:CRP-like cAMP-binding protein